MSTKALRGVPLRRRQISCGQRNGNACAPLWQLHADDFQLINPYGIAFSKEQYLGGIASGEIHYLVWEPESIAVRQHGEMAILRYQAQLEIIVSGQKLPLRRFWHTDSYEKRDGRWQVVWSQATEIRQ